MLRASIAVLLLYVIRKETLWAGDGTAGTYGGKAFLTAAAWSKRLHLLVSVLAIPGLALNDKTDAQRARFLWLTVIVPSMYIAVFAENMTAVCMPVTGIAVLFGAMLFLFIYGALFF